MPRKRRDLATSSYSMDRALHRRLSQRLPVHGDRSKLVARMIEMYLNGEIQVTGVNLRSRNVAHSNTMTPPVDLGWQQP